LAAEADHLEKLVGHDCPSFVAVVERLEMTGGNCRSLVAPLMAVVERLEMTGGNYPSLVAPLMAVVEWLEMTVGNCPSLVAPLMAMADILVQLELELMTHNLDLLGY